MTLGEGIQTDGLPEDRDERGHPSRELCGAGRAPQQVAAREGVSRAGSSVWLHLKVVVHPGLLSSPEESTERRARAGVRCSACISLSPSS